MINRSILLLLAPLVLSACALFSGNERNESATQIEAPPPTIQAPPRPGQSAEALHQATVTDPNQFAFREQEERVNDPHRFLMVGHVTEIWTPQHFDFETAGIPYRIKLAGTQGLFFVLKDLFPKDPFYLRTMHWLKKRILNREIHVVFDPSAVHQDRYSQLVLYVFYQADDSGEWIFLNREMIEEGYAIYKEQEGWLHDKELRMSERKARIAYKGVWGEEMRRNNEKMKKAAELEVHPDELNPNPRTNFDDLNPDPTPPKIPCPKCEEEEADQ